MSQRSPVVETIQIERDALAKSYTVRLDLFQWKEQMPLRGPEPIAASYPIAALGKFAEAAKVITDQVQAPAPVVAQSILAASSLVAQPHIDVQIDGREFPVSLYLITVAASGERKTATDRIVVSPIKKHERKLLSQYNDDFKTWSVTLEELKTKEKKKPLDRRAIMDHEEEKPTYPMLLTKEPTYEGLVRSLHDGLPSMGLFSDEAGRFIGGYAMSEENILKTAAGLSELWDGSEITRTRGADKQIFVMHDRRLAMHLMLQPVVAYRIISNPLLMGQGFLPRCLVAQPESRIGSRMYIEASTRDHPAVVEMCQRLTALIERRMTLQQDEKSQRNIKLDADAKAYWIELHNEFEVAAAKEYESIQAMACKAGEHVARIAAVLAYLDNDDLNSIPLGAVERAVSLTGFYLNESLRLQQIAEEDQQIQFAEKCLEWAFNENDQTVVQWSDDNKAMQFHMQGFLQRGPKRLRTKAKAERVIKLLHDHGLARKLPTTRFSGTDRKEAWEFRKYEYEEKNA